MSKLNLIIKREYLTRVRKKSFIIGTLLAPVGLLVYFLVIVGLTQYESGGELRVVVQDEAGVLGIIPEQKDVRYIPAADRTLEQLKHAVTEGQYDGVLRIPPLTTLKQKDLTVFYYSDQKLALEKREFIERRVSKKVREFKIDSLHLDRASLEYLDTDVSIDPEKITDKGEDESKYTIGVGLVIGGVMAFIMFFMVMMYG